MAPEAQHRTAAPSPAAAEPQSLRATTRAAEFGSESTARVQGLAGNLAVSRALAASGIRPKLTVSQPGDPEEEEADRVANAVVNRSAVSAIAEFPAPVIRRQCAACAGGKQCQECEAETIRPKLATPAAAVGNAGVQRAVDVAGSGGTPLPPALRSAWESQFRRDFSDVRIHTGGGAGEAARTIGARAYVVGPHIVFAPGEFRPEHRDGQRLLAHELTHVAQTGRAVRRDTAPPATAAPADPSTVKAAADVIVDALDGYTSANDSENILKQFRGKDAGLVLAIVAEVKNRGTANSKTADEMFDWLLGDLTEENRRELRQILIKSRSPDAERLLIAEINDRLDGYTSEDDSSEIVTLFSGSVGSGIDALLVGLETAMHQDRDTMRDQLFGDLYRVSAERLRQLFFAQGGTVALGYATARTARKIMDLIEGYTSHSDSTDIVWNFSTTPVELRALVHVRLDELCRKSRNEASDDALMHDMDANDYERLRSMGGLALKTYKDTRSTAEKAVAALEWVEVVAEWTTCGVIGIATGLASAIWDILKGIKDIVVAIWDLIWSLVYLLSRGAAGSENWLRVKNFFSGIGNLFSDPGKVWDQFWEEQALEFHTIEGPLADCRRAEFWVRKIISALSNVALIFLAGYGVAKGVVAGARAVAEGAALADIIGVRGVIWVAGRLASRRIGRFVAVAGEVAEQLLAVIRAPVAALRNIGARIRVVLLAADDVGYWRYLRQQAGVAVEAGTDAVSKQLAGERQFWEENNKYWNERGLAQQTRYEELFQDFQTVEEHLGAKEQPDPPSTVRDLQADAQQLEGESATLHSTVTGKAEPQTSTGATPTQPPPTTTGAAPVSIEQMIAEELADFQAEPIRPLDPASFGKPPRRIVASLRDISLDEIPPDRRGFYEAAYPGYQQRRLAEIARGISPNRQPMLRDDYVRFRFGRDTGVLVQGAGGPVDLGRPGVIEQLAGHVLEKVVDARLPGSSNTMSFPNPFGEPMIPDHLPPGQSAVFLDAQGRKAAAGQRFSARFVGDSKYRTSIPVNDQTRGFVNLAKFSDEGTLVFYVRWQEGFPAAETLALDPALGGHVLPVRPWNANIVSRELRELAGNRGVKIRLVSDPAWR